MIFMCSATIWVSSLLFPALSFYVVPSCCWYILHLPETNQQMFTESKCLLVPSLCLSWPTWHGELIIPMLGFAWPTWAKLSTRVIRHQACGGQGGIQTSSLVTPRALGLSLSIALSVCFGEIDTRLERSKCDRQGPCSPGSIIYSILWEKSQKYDLEKCDLLLDLELTEDGVYMYSKNIFEKR